MQENYEKGLTYSRLRIAVRQAWNAVDKRRLNHLVDEMHDRCQAVIDAKEPSPTYNVVPGIFCMGKLQKKS